MKIKGIIEEDFINYKEPSMFIMFPYCSFKCEIEQKGKFCQNSNLVNIENIDVSVDEIIEKYLSNDITKAIILGGLEPFDSFDDVLAIICTLREKYGNLDNVVIYTGYNKNEIEDKIQKLQCYSNIIIKFGRYIPNGKKVFDAILGVTLSSENQYGEIIGC